MVGVETEAKDTGIQKFQPGSKNWTLSQNPPQRAPNIVERASGSGSAGLIHSDRNDTWNILETRYTFSDLGNTMKHSMKHSRNMTQQRSEAEQISSAGDSGT